MPSGVLQPVFVRATALLERGQAGQAVELLAPMLRSGRLPRLDELQLRSALAEAHVATGELSQAATVLGRSPDAIREPLPPVLAANLWRLHGRLAFVKGDQSRAIALHGRALKQAEVAHDSRAIGQAHYELGLCYKKVGDISIVREHIAEAAAAFHAAGDRRHLALVHSLSGVILAQSGRYDEATSALRQAERLASALSADDVLAIVCLNQANVALMRHRYEPALALAERAVTLQEGLGPNQGLAGALATLGQICVRFGHLERAEQVLHRALQVRSGARFHETTGAVYDTLAQMSLMRGDYEHAAEYLRQAADAYGGYGHQTSRWYEWSVRVISARLAIRQGRPDEALAAADEIVQSPAAPPAEALEASLIAADALLSAGRVAEAEGRLRAVESRLDPRATPGAWGELLRLRGRVHASLGRSTEAYHDIAQSASVFELVGERYQAATSQLALGRLAGAAGAHPTAVRHYRHAASVFQSLGAQRDLEETRKALASPARRPLGNVSSPVDADDALVRRLVDAALLPELLARELAASLLEAVAGESAVVYVQLAGGEVRLLAHAGTDGEQARRLAVGASRALVADRSAIVSESVGRDADGPRCVAIAVSHPVGDAARRRVRMLATVARQGFELSRMREQPATPADVGVERPLEPLIPGLVCASAAMHRVIDQIQRLQGSGLTVLITGESGTGKELIARAIHIGSPRRSALFLPYNCTTMTRDLADSTLFGHRRGAFTGAVADHVGLVRTALGGTLFLDEVGDLPLDVQPKLLRFLEEGEIMPLGETRPQRVDVRVLAATNADLEQRVADGSFREDLYYRLSVIRIHVPPLRQRREEIPHLSTFFLREWSERLGKPDVQLNSEALDLFAQYWWPGNVRQLRNEVQRAVAMAVPGGVIGPEHLSPELSADPPAAGGSASRARTSLRGGQTLASVVDDLERDVIRETLARLRGNISESARALGLTRRGLYLKLRRLGLEPEPN